MISSSEVLKNCFSPETENFSSCLFNTAFRAGMAFIDFRSHQGLDSILALKRIDQPGNDMTCEQFIEVQSLTQGSYILDNLVGNRPVDIIKINTEGHEPQVFRGMAKTILCNPKIRIFIEFNPNCLIKSGHDPDKFLKEIDRNGFDIYFIDDQERKLFRYSKENPEVYRTIMQGRSHVNLLCIKKEFSVFVNLISHSAGNAGAERLLADTVDFFLEENFLVHVTLPTDGHLNQRFRQLPVSVDINPLPHWTYQAAQNRESYNQMLVSSLPSFFSGISTRNPHLLFTNTSVIPQGAFAAGLLGLPHIWRITEFGLPEFDLDFLVEETVRKQFITAGAEKVIFVSNALKHAYEAFLGKEQGVTMYSSVHFLSHKSSIGPYEKKALLEIIYPATICPGKRQEDLIHAVHILDQRGIHSIRVKLFGTGDAAYEKKLRDLIHLYKLESKAVILPFVHDLWENIGGVEMVVSASVDEGFGRIIAEGMASGKFVIGTDSGATRELISHGVTGLLYHSRDPEDLADKIMSYINEDIDIPKIRQNAFEFAIGNFYPEPYRKQLAQIVHEIVAGNRSKSSINYSVLYSNMFFKSFLNALFLENKNISQEVGILKDELASANKSGQELKLIITGQETEISSLRASWSWTLTKPVRYIHSLIFHLLRNINGLFHS